MTEHAKDQRRERIGSIRKKHGEPYSCAIDGCDMHFFAFNAETARTETRYSNTCTRCCKPIGQGERAKYVGLRQSIHRYAHAVCQPEADAEPRCRFEDSDGEVCGHSKQSEYHFCPANFTGSHKQDSWSCHRFVAEARLKKKKQCNG